MSERANMWMAPAECQAMRIPDLGVAILRRLAGLNDTWRNDFNFVEWTVDGDQGWFPRSRTVVTAVYIPGNAHQAERDALTAKLRRAWAWLAQEGYVVDDHRQRDHWKVITPEGWAIARSADPEATLRRVQAAAQLNIELHLRLRAARVDATFRSGDTHSAIDVSRGEIFGFRDHRGRPGRLAVTTRP